MSTESQRRENAKLKRMAGCRFSRKRKCGTGSGRDANEGLHRARAESRIEGASPIISECGAVRSGATARHRAMVISAAPAACGKVGFLV